MALRLPGVRRRDTTETGPTAPAWRNFRGAVLLGTRRFTGMPMPKHVAMPNLSAELFERWLALWRETTDALPNRALADAAQEMARRMARSLWYGYQLSRDPSQPLTELRPA